MFERDRSSDHQVFDAPFGDLVADRASRQDLKRVEVDVDRVGVACQVYELPDLVVAEHRKEGRHVLEVRSNGAIPRCHVIVGDGQQTGAVRILYPCELAHGEHVRLAFELALDERNRPASRACQLLG